MSNELTIEEKLSEFKILLDKIDDYKESIECLNDFINVNINNDNEKEMKDLLDQLAEKYKIKKSDYRDRGNLLLEIVVSIIFMAILNFIGKILGSSIDNSFFDITCSGIFFGLMFHLYFYLTSYDYDAFKQKLIDIKKTEENKISEIKNSEIYLEVTNTFTKVYSKHLRFTINCFKDYYDYCLLEIWTKKSKANASYSLEGVMENVFKDADKYIEYLKGLEEICEISYHITKKRDSGEVDKYKCNSDLIKLGMKESQIRNECRDYLRELLKLEESENHHESQNKKDSEFLNSLNISHDEEKTNNKKYDEELYKKSGGSAVERFKNK